MNPIFRLLSLMGSMGPFGIATTSKSKTRPSDAEIEEILARVPNAAPYLNDQRNSVEVTPGGDIAFQPSPGHAAQVKAQSEISADQAPVIFGDYDKPLPPQEDSFATMDYDNPLIGDASVPGAVGSDYDANDSTLTMAQKSDPVFMRDRRTVLAMGEWNGNPFLQRQMSQAEYVKSVLADCGL